LKAKLPRKHHYLPEFYTKRWAGQDGHLIRYSLVSGGKVDQKRVTPGGVGFQRDLYTFPMYEDDKAQELELGLFSCVDNYGSLAIEEMEKGKIPQQNELRTAFATFALGLMQRTPHAIESEMDAIREQMNQKVEMLPEYDVGVRLVALIRLFYMTDASPIGRAVINMDWNLIEAPPSVSLLTCDDPVLLYGRGGPIPTYTPWFPTSELESFAMPISPHRLLVGHWRGRGPTDLEMMSAKMVARTFNRFVVQNAVSLVIALDDSHSDFVRKHLGARRDNKGGSMFRKSE
jgi:hypothetical protein